MTHFDLQIRREQPADYRATEQMVREAFWNLYSPGCAEHYLLHLMRGSRHFVPELDHVATAGGRIVGAVVCQKAFIMGDDGNRYDVLSLGPIAVLPSCQHQGIGRMLLRHAIATAAGRGFRAILLCGEPEFYAKVGFVPAKRFGIRTAQGKYFAALHARPLYAGTLKDAAGRYFEDDIYFVDEAEAAAFFPPVPAQKAHRRDAHPAALRRGAVHARRRPAIATPPDSRMKHPSPVVPSLPAAGDAFCRNYFVHSAGNS